MNNSVISIILWYYLILHRVVQLNQSCTAACELYDCQFEKNDVYLIFPIEQGCDIFTCPSNLVLAFKTFLRSKTILHLPKLLVRLGLFTIILHVPLMRMRSGHSLAYFSCASSH